MTTTGRDYLIVHLQPAPNSPLNLKLDAVYAPRIDSPPYLGFSASETSGQTYSIFAYDEDGNRTDIYRGDLFNAFKRLAWHLRMDVAPVGKRNG